MHPLELQVVADLQDLHPTPQFSALLELVEAKYPSAAALQLLEVQVRHPAGQGAQMELDRK